VNRVTDRLGEPHEKRGAERELHIDTKTDRLPSDDERREVIGRVSFANGEREDYTDPEEYLRCIREELPYHPTSGFRYETLTRDPAIRKQVDDILYDLYGEKNPRTLEDYKDTPGEGITMGGMSQ